MTDTGSSRNAQTPDRARGRGAHSATRAGGRSSAGFGVPAAQLKQYFATGRIPREQDFNALLQVAEVGRRITNMSPGQPAEGAFGLTTDAGGKFQVTDAFLAGLVSVEAFEALTAEDQQRIWEVLVAAAATLSAAVPRPPAAFPLRRSLSESDAGPPASDMLASFGEATVQLQGDYEDLIDVANIGRRAAGLEPEQSGPGRGMAIDENKRLDFSEETVGQLVSVAAFEGLSDADNKAIHELLLLDRVIVSDQTRYKQGYGAVVAMNGEGSILAVSDAFRTVNGVAEAGAVDLHRFDGQSWTLFQTLSHPTPWTGQHFGATVSLSASDQLVITSEVDTSVQLYSLVEGSFIFSANLTRDGGAQRVSPGSLSISGNGLVVAVGHFGDREGPTVLIGSVSVFVRESIDEPWRAPVKLRSSAMSFSFGWCVALDQTGHTLVVGDPLLGPTLIFSRAGYDWIQKKVCWAAGGELYSGETVTISSDGHSIATKASNYEHTDSSFFCARLDVATDTWGDLKRIAGTGSPVAPPYRTLGNIVFNRNATKVAIGIPSAIAGGQSGAGSVYIYSDSGSGWVHEQFLQSDVAFNSASFGAWIAVGSDFDLAVGEPFAIIDDTQVSGKVTVFPLSESASLAASDEPLPGKNLWRSSDRDATHLGDPVDRARASTSRSADAASAPVGPPFDELSAQFASGLTPLAESYAALIAIADIGRRAIGLAVDQEQGPGAGLGLDEEGRVHIAAELEDCLVSVPAFESLSAYERTAICNLLLAATYGSPTLNPPGTRSAASDAVPVIVKERLRAFELWRPKSNDRDRQR